MNQVPYNDLIAYTTLLREVEAHMDVQDMPVGEIKPELLAQGLVGIVHESEERTLTLPLVSNSEDE